MVVDQNLNLLGLMSSRILHDVMTPVGAMEMGLSLLEEEKTEDIIHLLQTVHGNLKNKLVFFRHVLTFHQKDIHLPIAKDALKNFLSWQKKELVWEQDPNLNVDSESELSSIIMLLGYLLSEALLSEGSLSIKIFNKNIEFSLEGYKIVLNKKQFDMLSTGQQDELNSHTIFCWVLIELLKKNNLSFSIQEVNPNKTICKLSSI